MTDNPFGTLKRVIGDTIRGTFNDSVTLLDTDLEALRKGLTKEIKSIVDTLLDKKLQIQVEQRGRAVQAFHKALCTEIKGYRVKECAVCFEPEGMVPVWLLMCGHQICVECSSSRYLLSQQGNFFSCDHLRTEWTFVRKGTPNNSLELGRVIRCPVCRADNMWPIPSEREFLDNLNGQGNTEMLTGHSNLTRQDLTDHVISIIHGASLNQAMEELFSAGPD